MSCIEKRQHKNLEEQEHLLRAWAGENNVKQCPSCQAWVEKVEGCHHINCRCGVHFCWICAGVFDANSIYDHMTRVHGGWYNDPGHGQRQAEAGGQPRGQVQNIVQIAGDQVAVAEQAAELRLELLRRNRATRPIINQGANLLRANPQPARHEGWPARIGLYDQGRPQAEADEQRRTPEEFEQVRREQQAREEEMRCQQKAREEEMRREQQAREEEMRCQQQAREEEMRCQQQAREEEMRCQQQAREEEMRCQQKVREEQMRCQQQAREEQMRCQQQAREEQMRCQQQAREKQMRPEAREAEENKWCVVM